MKKENKNSMKNTPSGITRKDAIKKMGKYAALTAVGTFMILNPKEAQASSAPPGPGWGSGKSCLLYTSPSPRDGLLSRMPSSA